MFTVTAHVSWGRIVETFESTSEAIKRANDLGVWSYAHVKVTDPDGNVIATGIGQFTRPGNWKLTDGEWVPDTSPEPQPRTA